MVTLLDGGMGREIQERRPRAAHGLWSASVLLDEPDLVVEIHREYIDAGAVVITTNNYSTIPSYLGKAGMQDRYRELTRLAATLACRAVRESGKGVAVAGSLPPLEESYRADLVPPPEVAHPIYQGVVEALRDDVDLFICETMSSAAEAHTAASAALGDVDLALNVVGFTGPVRGSEVTRLAEQLQAAAERLAGGASRTMAAPTRAAS